ncbi:MAG: hypothetical protein AB1758_27850 [Candidatus Eremiobacterota bacterium]
MDRRVLAWAAGGWLVLGGFGAASVSLLMRAQQAPERPWLAFLALAPWGMLAGAELGLFLHQRKAFTRGRAIRLALTAIGGCVTGAGMPLLVLPVPLLVLLLGNLAGAAALGLGLRRLEQPLGGLECGLMAAAVALLGYDLMGWLTWPLAGILAAAAYLKMQPRKEC